MILVDVYIPSVDQTYDFNIDENVPVASVIEEIASMVSQKEQCVLRGDPGALVLCSPVLLSMLPPEKTLKQCGIDTGHPLILV